MTGSVEASFVPSMADQISAAADLLTTVDRTLPDLGSPAAGFGADEAGLPGRVGRRLHAHWFAVLAARAEEAADTAAGLTDMATSVRTTARHYAETDMSVANRLEAL